MGFKIFRHFMSEKEACHTFELYFSRGRKANQRSSRYPNLVLAFLELERFSSQLIQFPFLKNTLLKLPAQFRSSGSFLDLDTLLPIKLSAEILNLV